MRKSVELFLAVTVKNCLSTNPAVDLPDVTDVLVIDHLLLLVVFRYYQVPESTGAEMLPG